MANHLGNKLNRIIRDIAYTKGELLSQKSVADKAKEQLVLSANEFKNARSAIRAADIRLAELQKALACQSASKSFQLSASNSFQFVRRI